MGEFLCWAGSWRNRQCPSTPTVQEPGAGPPQHRAAGRCSPFLAPRILGARGVDLDTGKGGGGAFLTQTQFPWR